eukprot:INCI12519.2.p1 GENE.INCI12519.2~~INCI12519.2.p1  ORF type:complete len:369 (-),score=63.15 INCI12519.2:256-1362(-)
MEVATIAKFVGGGVVLLHAGVLLSVPYVLMGKGAPYLPTFAKPMRQMFDDLLPKHLGRVPSIRKHLPKQDRQPALPSAAAAAAIAAGGHNKWALADPGLLRQASLVDLGSGDGRLVFEAARQGYGRCEGYEINPLLYLFSELWLLKHRAFGGLKHPVQPKPRIDADSTQHPQADDLAAGDSLNSAAVQKFTPAVNFYLRDFWNVDLGHADVVIVYGLTPIMERLSQKLWNELKPGALIVSNVFSLPVQVGWRQVGGEDGVFIYTKPISGEEAEMDNVKLLERTDASHVADDTSPTPKSDASPNLDRERARLQSQQKTGGFFFNISNAAAVQHELQTLERHAKAKETMQKRRGVLEVCTAKQVAKQVMS